MTALFTNNASSRLPNSIGAGNTSVLIWAGDGAKFPSPTAPDWFMVTLEDRRTGQIEICQCTARNGDTLTLVRAQEGTLAQAFSMGATVSNRMTAGAVSSIYAYGYSKPAADAKFVDVAGDTMTGQLSIPLNPGAPANATSKQYVDQQIALIGGVSEPPNDGKDYARHYQGWTVTISKVTYDAFVSSQASKDATQDGQIAANTSNIATNTTNIATNTTNITTNATNIANNTSAIAAIQTVNGNQDVSIANLQTSKADKTYVDNQDALKANIASPIFTGDPKAPTPTAGDNDTSIATTAFVTTALNNGAVSFVAKSGDVMTGPLQLPAGSAATPSLQLAATNVGIYSASGAINFSTAGTLRVTINNGAVQSAVPFRAPNGTVGAPGYTFTNDTNSGLYRPVAGGLINMAMNGIDIMSWATAGNVTSVMGPLMLAADPTANLQAATKQYADTKLSEAPQDGLTYGRKNATWATVIGGAHTDDLPPPGPLVDGQLWWKSDVGTFYVYYDDGNSKQWVQAAAPPSPTLSDPYPFATANMRLYSKSAGVVALNNKADGTGIDIATFNTTGDFTVTGALSCGALTATTGAFSSNLAAGGSVTANQNFVSSTTIAIMGSTGAGACYLRPNGVGSTAGQMYVDNAGNANVAGNFTSGGLISGNQVNTNTGFVAVSSNAIVACTGAGGVYLRPNGVGNAAGQLQITGSNGIVQGGNGYQCKGGTSGAYGGNVFNMLYSAGAYLYIDLTNMGMIAYQSDYRIKKDVTDLSDMWDTVKALRPIRYTQADYSAPPSEDLTGKMVEHPPLFVADDVERWGFIAHELQATMIDSAATGYKDVEGAIQSPNPWTVIAALTKALQEAMARIEALEAR